MKPLLIYCYDAYCGWCYGFSPVIKQISTEYKNQLGSDVLSGGMILPKEPVHIEATASYILAEYGRIEELTGITFGPDYLWHVKNVEDSDWYPNSEKPAIAMSIMKELLPERAIEFAADLQYALYFEGRDLTDNEAYRHLLEKYKVSDDIFYDRLKSDEYKEKAYYDFALVKQLDVSGFPCVFIQTDERKLTMVARGYTDIETLRQRVESVLLTLH